MTTQSGTEKRVSLKVLPGYVRVVVQYEAAAVDVVVIDVIRRVNLNRSVPSVAELRNVFVRICYGYNEEGNENERVTNSTKVNEKQDDGKEDGQDSETGKGQWINYGDNDALEFGDEERFALKQVIDCRKESRRNGSREIGRFGKDRTHSNTQSTIAGVPFIEYPQEVISRLETNRIRY